MAMPRKSSGGGGASTPPRISAMKNHTKSWTDDLPVCHLSGVGFSTNQIYREDGSRCEEHEFEDKSFHFRLDNDMFLYGVFDGHDGSRASHFAAQRIPAEILLDQLHGKTEDEDIHHVLHQAFIAVEKGFFESIDDDLAEMANLQMQLPEGLTPEELYDKHGDIMNKIQQIEADISGGTTAVVALVYNNKLYVANVGNSRALLCRTDASGTLRVIQLTTDHAIDNEDEQYRLSQLGLDVPEILKHGTLGNQIYTRCIGGCLKVKGGYKELDLLRNASREPVIAEPEINGGIPLDESCRCLILMTDGLYRSLEDATGAEHVNADLVAMVAGEFSVQSTLNGVAQAVVDKVVRFHHDTYMISSQAIETKQLCQRRDDITLLVRNFNFPLPNAIQSPTSGKNPILHLYPRKASAPAVMNPNSDAHSETMPDHQNTNTDSVSLMLQRIGTRSSTYTNTNTVYGSTYTSTGDSTESGDGNQPFSRRSQIVTKLELDEDGKIAPYVDFTEFYQAIAELTEVQKKAFLESTPQSEYAIDIIEEENDTVSPKEQEEKNIKADSED
ncbi:TGF-beta-activated kinase 1 and MAP3K7-binding protein 1-like [Tubulanus polymorphus]|uniref:TGF-beta-activated kinase 1 and MAP3K7-binding protein 1-like n=1 Tax=Tubulanus polymorphus TaxID=672921 RepID=UPI003DA34D9B